MRDELMGGDRVLSKLQPCLINKLVNGGAKVGNRRYQQNTPLPPTAIPTSPLHQAPTLYLAAERCGA
jgi:hypothetical protein